MSKLTFAEIIRYSGSADIFYIINFILLYLPIKQQDKIAQNKEYTEAISHLFHKFYKI